MRINKEKTIGLVIDIQERLFPVMHNKEALLKKCTTLISGLKILGIPLIITQQYTKGLGETIEEIKPLIMGSPLIEKRDFSCCDEPLFPEEIKKTGAKNIIICGIESHVCILQTAVDLKDSGLNPIIVADCISSRYEEDKITALDRFRFEGIMMSSCESILFEITRSSMFPEFKAISKIVK